MANIRNEKIFKDFIGKAEHNFKINDIEINKIHFFGTDKVGFIDLTVDVEDKNGNWLPGICFLRGNSVAVLVVLVDEQTKEEFFLLTYQPRVPTGKYIYETIAGMTDGEEVKGQAVNELVEEGGQELKIHTNDLIFLESGYNSPGVLDEWTDIYYVKKEMPKSVIDKFRNRESGLEEEQIVTVVVTGKEFLKIVESLPSKIAYYAYKAL